MLIVEWTDKAKLSLKNIEEYIVLKFGDNKFNETLYLIDDCIGTIHYHPKVDILNSP